MTNIRGKITLLIGLVLSLLMIFVLSSCDNGETPADSSINSSTDSSTDTGTDSGTKEPEKCTVTFDSNGGTEVSAQSVEMNKKATEPTAPTRAGYTFNGWYMGEEKWSFIGYVVTEDMTLVAKWTANENTLSFNANGGKGAMVNETVATDSQVNLTANAFVRTGYTFMGWSTTASGAVEYIDGASYTMDACDTTLYAVWQAISYDITYELNGGTNNEENPSTYNIEQSFELESPTKDGYTFAGWYSDSSFNNNVTEIAQGTTGEKTFYANWTPNENTLVFDANGGNGTMASMTLATGSSSVLGSCTYAKDGYTFVGWSTNASGGVEYETGDTYTMGTNPSYTLYAVWQANNNTLVFDANGGSGSMENVVATTGSSINLASNAFTRLGYTFKGWSTTKDGALEYGNNATYVLGTSSINTLYAVWQANENTLFFNANGGSGAMDNMTIATDSQAKLTVNKFTRPGYTFIGWSSTSDGAAEYSDGASYTMGADTTYTLYAVWEKNINGLIFNGNGATSGTPSTMELETGKTIVLPQNTFAKTGYTFKGWSTERDGAIVYTDGASYTMGTDGTYYLYAVWQANNNTLSFNTNGGNGSIDNMTVATDSKITLPQNAFTKAGYTFMGWSTTVNGEVEYIDGASYTMGVESVNTLYAVWEANENTLVFNANSGVGSMSNMTIATDSTANLTVNAFTKAGYTFIGWSTTPDGEVEYTDGASYTMGTISSYTLYAVWEANENTLVFNSNGGEGNMENMTVCTDTSVTLPSNIFTRLGYTFVGWSTTFDGEVEYTDGGEYTMGTESTYTFYAVWEANENTLVFNANSGEGTMENMTICTDSTTNLTANVFTKAGYTFMGWSTTQGAEVEYTDGASYTMGVESVNTLYAVWQGNPNTLVFDANGGFGNMSNMTIATDSTANLTLNSFTKAGHAFIGWSTTPDESVEYLDGSEYVMGTNVSYTLYAVWELRNSYTIIISDKNTGKPIPNISVFIQNEASYDGSIYANGKTDDKGVFNCEINPQYAKYVHVEGFKKGYIYEDFYELGATGVEIEVGTQIIENNENSFDGKRLALGDVMYDFDLSAYVYNKETGKIETTRVKLSDLFANGKKAVMLNFWYTTNSYNIEEFPYIQAAYEMYGDDIEVIGLNASTDSGWDIMYFIEWFAKPGYYTDEGCTLTFPLTRDTLDIYEAFGFNAYPSTVIIDRYGVISLVQIGMTLNENYFINAFDHYVADDYEQKLYSSIYDRDLLKKPNIEMSSEEEIKNAAVNGNINISFAPETKGEDADYVWPFIVYERGGEMCLASTTNNFDNSYCTLYVDVELKAGQAIVFDCISSTEKQKDILYVLVDGEEMYTISGEENEWKSFCPWVATKDGTYNLAFHYIKDLNGKSGDDRVYIDNFRVVNAENIEFETYIPRYALIDDYVDVIYSEEDGYYHVGTENGPILLANLLNINTKFARMFPENERYSVATKLYEKGEFIYNNANVYDIFLAYVDYATYSKLYSYCPVTDELKCFIDEFAKQNSIDYDSSMWLQFCSYYDAYGTDKQLDDPIKGLAPFSAYEAVVTHEGEEDFRNVVTYTHMISPKGYLYKFVPTKSGVYRITSNSTQEVEGWVFIGDFETWINENGGNRILYIDSLTGERYCPELLVDPDGDGLYERDYTNCSMIGYFEEGCTYYIDIAYYDIYATGTFTFDLKFVGESFDVFEEASQGPFSFDELTGEIIATGIDVKLCTDESDPRYGYYCHLLPNGELGSIIYADFYCTTNIFTSHSLVTLIDIGAFDMRITDMDLQARAYYDRFGEDGLRDFWGDDFDYFWEFYQMDDIIQGIYHGTGPDYTDAMRAYIDKMDDGTDGTNEDIVYPERLGCVAVDSELAVMLQALMDKFTFEGVDHSWTKVCYYYKHLGN